MGPNGAAATAAAPAPAPARRSSCFGSAALFITGHQLAGLMNVSRGLVREGPDLMAFNGEDVSPLSSKSAQIHLNIFKCFRRKCQDNPCAVLQLNISWQQPNGDIFGCKLWSFVTIKGCSGANCMKCFLNTV